MAKFHRLRYNSQAVSEASMDTPPSLRGMTRTTAASPSPAGRPIERNDEAAARSYVSEFLKERDEPDLHVLTAPDRPEVVPDLTLRSTQESPLTKTRVLRFAQTSRTIPIFGANAVVEIEGDDRKLVALNASLADTPNVSPIANISPVAALHRLAEQCGTAIDQLGEPDPPSLNYFLNRRSDSWHLVYHFSDVRADPPVEPSEDPPPAGGHGHGSGGSPRTDLATFEFLVDAHEGNIVYHFPSHAMIDIPVPCEGEDDEGAVRQFFGLKVGTEFQMRDPLREIETYDHNFADITSPSLPSTPIANSSVNFDSTNTAGVSAHYYATKVFDFYNNVLKRSGVDDKGMKLVSLVNCTYSGHNPPPNWRNAVWWNGRMWYGQTENGGSGFDSYARFLDVIAHELTHGVTEHTSDLVYRDLSGALNESFSDIFGIAVKNWFPGEPNPINNWNWEIGPGLGGSGLPLRDMSDPTRTGDPDHFSQYVPTTRDNGGVHIYSNIHNKAAYNLFNVRDDNGTMVVPDAGNNGDRVFTPEEVCVLYYLTLTRLAALDEFTDCRAMLESVASTYYGGNPAEQSRRLAAIAASYDAVGIA